MPTEIVERTRLTPFRTPAVAEALPDEPLGRASAEVTAQADVRPVNPGVAAMSAVVVQRLANARALAPGAARGGGPPAPSATQAGAAGQIARIEGQLETVPIVLPIGCRTVTAVGTPAVRRVALEFVQPDGTVQRFDQDPGRIESAQLCASEAGRYELRVRLGGSGGVVASQVFVE